jgi:hypothetical protein
MQNEMKQHKCVVLLNVYNFEMNFTGRFNSSVHIKLMCDVVIIQVVSTTFKSHIK